MKKHRQSTILLAGALLCSLVSISAVADEGGVRNDSAPYGNYFRFFTETCGTSANEFNDQGFDGSGDEFSPNNPADAFARFLQDNGFKLLGNIDVCGRPVSVDTGVRK